jgi:hypothetical protein
MYIPDLSTVTRRPHPKDGFEYRSVGWLGDRVEHPGDTDPFVVAVLQHLWNTNQLPDDRSDGEWCALCGPDAPLFLEVDDDEALVVAEVGVGLCRGAARGFGLLPPAPDCIVERGEFFIQYGSTRFVLPNLVLHYLARHRYKLPEVVEAAILRSAPFTREELEEAARLRAAKAEDESRDELEQAQRKGRADGLAAGHQSGLAEGLVEGEREGRKAALLRVLARVGIALTDSDRARIEACADPATTDLWLDLIIGARTAAEVLSAK